MTTSAVMQRTGWEDAGKLVLRLAVGGLLLFHGIAKVESGVGFIAGALGNAGLPAFIAYGVYVGEIVAPLLMMVGFFARPAALIIAFNMLVAILLVRRADIFVINERGGAWAIELEMFFLLGALAVFLLGSGRYAIGKGKWH